MGGPSIAHARLLHLDRADAGDQVPRRQVAVAHHRAKAVGGAQMRTGIDELGHLDLDRVREQSLGAVAQDAAQHITRGGGGWKRERLGGRFVGHGGVLLARVGRVGVAELNPKYAAFFMPSYTTCGHTSRYHASSVNDIGQNLERILVAKITHRIKALALQLLESEPAGIRYSELVRQVLAEDPTLKYTTATGVLWNLEEHSSDQVYKPSRGLLRLLKDKESGSEQPKPKLVPKMESKCKEEDFYQPFADWLVNYVEECTKAIALGGTRFRDKWGTPDVIGKRESKRSDIIQAPVEIVSAEIKPDVYQLVTAFGQACAYCLFSHKVYLVVSERASDEEIARLDALCQVFGLGLVLFDSENPKDPRFEIRCRPRYQRPDHFYANQYMRQVESELFAR